MLRGLSGVPMDSLRPPPRSRSGGMFSPAMSSPTREGRACRVRDVARTGEDAVTRTEEKFAATTTQTITDSAFVDARVRSAAANATVEILEDRRLMAGDASVVSSLPFSLEFDGPRGGMLDKNGN